MENQAEEHKLLIVSKDFEVYEQLLIQARLPKLSIKAFDDPQEAFRSGEDCDLLFGEPSLICQVLNLLPSLKWCQSSWAGVEPMLVSDLRRDYILTNARNVYGAMMSEYVFGYLLLIERRILQRWQSQLKRMWDESPSGVLQGKVIGLLGVGSIGSHLAATAHHFGMKVFGYTQKSETCPDVDRYFHGNALLDFASKLDYLVSSLPGTNSTKGIINRDLLSALPKHSWLVNIGRGNAVDESALAEALTSSSIAGAVLDVFKEEPLYEDHPLWRTPNTFITSHTAARNYPPDIAALFIENYKLFIAGKPLRYQVKFDQQY
jgi:phosphoglycerate dehydrogenase-like enzyme